MTSILLVEDNEMVSKVITGLLDKSGYLVFQAMNGKEALDLMEKITFDIVITDLMLPYVNGLELIQKIKTDITKRSVKIIVVSSVDNEPTISQAFKLGADDYLMKPVLPNQLITRVGRLAGQQ